jgi:hypothetical protein
MAKVWDAASGQEVLTLTMDIRELLNLARSRVIRDFMPDECKRYFQSETCPPLSHSGQHRGHDSFRWQGPSGLGGAHRN